VKDAVQINHLKDLYKVKSEFKYAMKSYCMEYYFAPSNDVTEAQPDSSLSEHKSSRSIKGAPLESLFAQFCLHALWFGNCSIRGIPIDNLVFNCCTLDRVCSRGSLVLGRITAITKNANQRHDRPIHLFDKSETTHVMLQYYESIKRHPVALAVCIDKKRREVKGQYDGTNDPLTSRAQEDLQVPMEFSASHGVSEGFGKKHDRNGSSGVAGSMMLLKARKIMHAPITQDPPLMTEDMHEERLRAAVALGDSFSFSGQLERDILASVYGKGGSHLRMYEKFQNPAESLKAAHNLPFCNQHHPGLPFIFLYQDMSAFKAANPEAVFEDFIRWHSPKDWENDDTEQTGVSQINATEVSEIKWPPSGRLSERMSDFGNSWRKIWNEALPLPASQQKPLLDPNREGEKVLHYLETLRPYQLLEQMVCTAFKAAADTLYQTSFGNLKQMATKIGQLYVTMASTLKYFQSHSTISDSDVIEDLRRLCTTFGHIEKLILLAASLHRKFLQSPHLAEAIFSDCYDYYLPNMGTGSAKGDTKKEFDRRQQVSLRDRNLIIGMFPPPTANQSWRKVLSMGNLLNGHEPILREIIFSKRDHVSGSYYSAPTPNLFQQDIETYRMYVCGTSNDLRVALAVTSFD
ncbi:UNVERIFIED_CONTAM: Rab3 GTPase-activating protein catalytic subunit, partial [Sesamum angustifolium]